MVAVAPLFTNEVSGAIFTTCNEPSCACTVISLSVIFVTVPSTCLSVPCANVASVTSENAKISSNAELILRIFISPLVWMWIRPPMCIRRLVQELVLHLFFLHLHGAARIHTPHVLQILVSQFRQMPDEQHQMPRIVIICPARSPRRHSCKTHAILNDVVNLAIREILRLRQTHVRNARIKFLPHLRGAAAIIPMAIGAMVCEMPPRFHQQLRRSLHRITQLASAPRNGPALHGTRQSRLHRARSAARAQPRRAQPEYSQDHHDQRNSQQQKQPRAERFHHAPRAADPRVPPPMITNLLILCLSSGTSI